MARAYYNRGNVKYDLKDYKGAIEDCQKAVQLDPQLIGAYFNLGISQYSLGNYEAAIQDFTSAIQANAKDAESYYWRGKVYLKLGNKALACADWGKASRLANGYATRMLNKYCFQESKAETGGY